MSHDLHMYIIYMLSQSLRDKDLSMKQKRTRTELKSFIHETTTRTRSKSLACVISLSISIFAIKMIHYWELAIKVIWLIICFIGNIYQVTIIMELYFEYDTVTAVDVSFPVHLIAPAMELCFAKVDLVKWDEMVKLKPDIKKKMNMSDLSNEEIVEKFKELPYTGKFAYDAIIFGGLDDSKIFNVTYEFSELISICKVIDNELMEIKEMKCDESAKIDTYITNIKKCFAMNNRINMTLNYLEASRMMTVQNFLYEAVFSPLVINSTDMFLVSFNENNQISRDGFFRFILLSNLQQLFSMTYEEYQTVLLPRPYESACMNFNDFWEEEWVINAGTCHESCLDKNIEETIGQNRKFPGQIGLQNLSDAGDDAMFFTVGEVLQNDKLKTQIRTLSLECNKLCGSPACNEIFYIPKLQTAVKYPFGAVLTYIMQSPKMTIVSFPKLPPIQCVTDAASTFGFWIGISVYNIIEYIEFIWKKAIKKSTKKDTQTRIGTQTRKDMITRKDTKTKTITSDLISKSNHRLRAQNHMLHQLIAENYDRCLKLDNWPKGSSASRHRT